MRKIFRLMVALSLLATACTDADMDMNGQCATRNEASTFNNMYNCTWRWREITDHSTLLHRQFKFSLCH